MQITGTKLSAVASHRHLCYYTYIFNAVMLMHGGLSKEADTDDGFYTLSKTDRYNIQAKAGCSDNEKVRITVQLRGIPALGKKGDVKSSSEYLKKTS